MRRDYDSHDPPAWGPTTTQANQLTMAPDDSYGRTFPRQHHGSLDASYSPNALESMFSVDTLFPDPKSSRGTYPQTGSRSENAEQNNTCFDLEYTDLNGRESISCSPVENPLGLLGTERHRRTISSRPSTRPDSAASTESTLDERLGYVISAAEEVGFDDLTTVMAAYASQDARERNKHHQAKPVPSDRTLLRLIATLPHSSKAWLSQKVKEDFPEAIGESLEEELAYLRDSGHQSSQSDRRKRAFVAETIAQLLRDEATRSLWQRDKRFLEEHVRIPSTSHSA